MKKTNLVLFVLLTSNVFVKPSREWQDNIPVAASAVLFVASCGTFYRALSSIDEAERLLNTAKGILNESEKIRNQAEDTLNESENLSEICRYAIQWQQYTGPKRPDMKAKIERLIQDGTNLENLKNPEEFAKIRSELHEIFGNLGIERS